MKLKKSIYNVFLSLILLFLYSPIFILILNSFNASRSRTSWGGFTFKWYSLLFKNHNILSSLENTIYTAINAYDLMIYQSLTINEVTEIILPNNKNENALIKYFYEELKYIFNSKKEKNNIGNMFKDFEEISNFSCRNIFNKTVEEIKSDTRASSLTNINISLIKFCKFIKITEINDFRTVFERHIQYVRNGISSLNDLSYEGIIKHLINCDYISKVSLFFDIIVINVLQLTNFEPHRKAFIRLIKKFKSLIKISEIIYLSSDIMAIFVVLLFYISGINSLFNQIVILRDVFKIHEVQE